MEYIECNKGHYYDSKRDASCPYCSGGEVFLMATMTWHTIDDINFDLIDTNGNEYYNGAQGYGVYDLSVDTEMIDTDERVEIWSAFHIQPGTYKIHYKFHTRRSSYNPTVKGYIRVGNEEISFNPKILHAEGSKILVATIIINDEKEVTVTKH